jgi:hypothetical protein
MKVANWIIEKTLRIQAIEIDQDKADAELKKSADEAERIRKKLNGAVKGGEATLATK